MTFMQTMINIFDRKANNQFVELDNDNDGIEKKATESKQFELFDLVVFDPDSIFDFEHTFGSPLLQLLNVSTCSIFSIFKTRNL